MATSEWWQQQMDRRGWWCGFHLKQGDGPDWPHYASGKPYWPEHELLKRAQSVAKSFTTYHEKFNAARLLASGFTLEDMRECRLALYVIERDRFPDLKKLPLYEIEAVLLDWKRSGQQQTVPMFIKANPARQLVLF